MIIDNGPSIRAFCEERLRQLKRQQTASTDSGSQIGWAAKIDELEMIVTLCNGLEAQSQIVNNMLAPYDNQR